MSCSIGVAFLHPPGLRDLYSLLPGLINKAPKPKSRVRGDDSRIIRSQRKSLVKSSEFPAQCKRCGGPTYAGVI